MAARDARGRFVGGGGRGGVTVTVRDNGERAMMRRIDMMSNRAITLGVHGEEGTNEAKGGGATVAEVATWNEFGTEQIPARPSITAYADEKGDEIRKDFDNGAKNVVLGKADLETVLAAIALKHENGIKAKVRAGIAPPNAERTIQRKGSSTPLIDTGQFVSSILGKVE